MNRSNPILGRLGAALRAAGRGIPAAALSASLFAGPAMAVRPDEAPAGPAGKSDAARQGRNGLRRLQMADLLDKGESLRQDRLALAGDAGGQILRRLNARLRAGGSEIRVRSEMADAKGNRHIRLDLYHGGYPVIGGDAVIHVNPLNEIYAVGGSFAEGLAPAAAARLAAKEAGELARKAADRPGKAEAKQEPRLVIFDGTLAYETLVSEPGDPPRLWRSYVDASTGEILLREDRILHAAPVGGAAHAVTGSILQQEGGGTVTINGWLDNLNLYFLRNNTALWGVYDQVRLDWAQNSTGDWGTTDRAAVSLARNLELTQRYVSQVIGRNSYDGAGAFANAYVHEGSNYVNAYWDGSGFHFGDGDGATAGPLTVLDVAGHEYFHAVTQFTSNLSYSYESGALNESFSDIHGALVEFWAQPDGRAAYPAGQDGRADWLMGEDCWLSSEALRDLRNPSRFGQPSYYRGSNWYTGSGDNGGVHTNSGVQNFAFYLLSEGGTGSNDGHPYSITGLGIQAAGAIAVYADMYLLTSGAQYQDAREAWVLAASTLGYDVQTVRDVWTACGVLQPVKHLSVSPASLAFGSVGTGTTATLNLAFANDGANPATVTALNFAGAAFSSPALVPLTVPGGSTVQVPVRFTPPAMGNHSGTLAIVSNADDNPSINIPLTGAGAPPAILMVSPGRLAGSADAGGSTTAILTLSNAGGADLRFTVEGRPQGGILINEFCNEPDFIELWNQGADRDIGGWRLSWVDDAASSVLSFTFPAGYVLRAGRRVVVREMTGTPDDSTFYAGANIGWVQGSTVAVTLADAAGRGVDFVRTSASATLPPAGTTWTSGGVDFSYYTAYRSQNQDTDGPAGWASGPTPSEFRLNPGQTAVSPFPTWLSAQPTSGTVRFGGNAPVLVTLNSAGLFGGLYRDTLRVISNDPNQPAAGLPIPVDFTVRGVKRLAAVPASLSFGNVWAGASATLSLTLRNDGSEATTVSAITSSHPEFQVPAAGLNIPPFGSLTVPVTFAPLTTGIKGGTLTLASDAADNPSLTVSLSGAGTQPPQLSLSPGAFSKSLAVGDTTVDTLTLANTGGADMRWSIRYAATPASALVSRVLARHQAALLPATAPDYLGRSGPDANRIPGELQSSAIPAPARPAGLAPADWKSLASMAAARSQFGLAAPGNGKLYAFGGWAGNSLFPSMEVYDIASGAWSAGAPIPVGDRGFASAVGKNGMIYLIGGAQAGSYRYDPGTGAWSAIAAPPQTSVWEAPAVTGDDGRIYVFGGGWSPIMNAVQIYDPAANAWTTGAPMPTARTEAGAVKLPGGLILVAGGCLPNYSLTDAAEIYDPASNTWSAAARMPSAKTQFATVAGDDGKVYAIGGKLSPYNNTGPFLADVAVYDPATGAWTADGAFPAAAGEFEALSSGGAFFAAGGADGAYSSALRSIGAGGIVSARPASGTLAPGASARVAVTFDARRVLGGTYAGNLLVTHEDPSRANPLPVPVTLAVDGVRRLSPSAARLDFGNVWAGAARSLDLTLRNDGSEATLIQGLAAGNPEFSVSAALPITVAPFSSVTVQVSFRPVDAGTETGTLVVTSDAEDNPSLAIALSGAGTPPPAAELSPSSFTLSFAPGQAPADRTATLTNTGGDILNWRVESVVQSRSPQPPPAPSAAGTPPPIRSDLIYAESNYAMPYVPGRVIVAFKPGASAFAVPSAAASLGILEMRELAKAVDPKTGRKAYSGRKLMLLEIRDPDGVRQAVDLLRRDANVAYAEPDYVQKAVAIPNDPSFGQLYGMHNTGQGGGTVDADIDAPEAWDRHTGNRSILIGVIDTGIDYLHPDLAANIWTNPGEIAGNGLDDDGNGFIDDVHGWDFAYDDSNPADGNMHGTHVSGTIAGIGNNGIGVAGVMWTASLVALKFLDDGGSGSTSDAIDAVNYAQAMGVRITSNSWGGGAFSQALGDAIAAGGLFVAAAGNSAGNNDVSPTYPASYPYPNIIAVAATDNRDALASFSCFGAASVDLGAPGVDIYSTSPGNSYRLLSGTSMATPHVSGAAGLVWSFNPSLTAAQVKAALLSSTDPDPALAGRTVTGGRLNVSRALEAAGPVWLTAGPTSPQTLAPGASAPINLGVDAGGLAAGRWTGIVNVATDDPAHAVLPIAIEADVAGCRSLEVSPASIDFGRIYVGGVARADVTLANACNDTVTVASFAATDPAFGLSAAAPLRVPPFGSITVQAEFRPVAGGAASAALSLNSNADADPVKTLNLSGFAAVPPFATANPPAISRSLQPGSAAVVDLDIGNTGGSDLAWALANVNRGFEPAAPYDASHFVALDKGAEDTRVGRPVTQAAGGPDAFGYRWIDSDQPGGPAYRWQDISATGALVLGSCDDCYASRNLSFSFPFYGASFSQVNITSNGWVNFGGASTQYSNYPLPNSGMPGYLVAAFFDDLTTYSGGVYFQDFGDRAVIQYQNVPYYSGSGTATFQIVLHSDGEIDYYYQNMTGSVLSSTTGVQNQNGTVGLGVQYNTQYVKNGLAVRINALPTWLKASAVSGTVPAGGSQRVGLTLDAGSLRPGTYSQTMMLTSNNTAQAPIPIVVDLTVTGMTGVSRVLRVGPSASAMASGNRYSLWNVTAGGETRGMARGSRFTLYLK